MVVGQPVKLEKTRPTMVVKLLLKNSSSRFRSFVRHQNILAFANYFFVIVNY